MSTHDLVEQFADPELSSGEYGRRPWLEQVPVDRIIAEAQQVRFGHAALSLLASALYGLAWIVGKFFRVLLVAAAFTVAALKVGWVDASGRGPTKAQLIEHNHTLETALKRMGGDAPAMATAMRGLAPDRMPR